MAKETKRIVGGQTREVTLTEVAQNSIEVSQNAKGDFSVSIKLYFTDEDAVQAVEASKALYDLYVALYKPEPSGIKLVKKEG